MEHDGSNNSASMVANKWFYFRPQPSGEQAFHSEPAGDEHWYREHWTQGKQQVPQSQQLHPIHYISWGYPDQPNTALKHTLVFKKQAKVLQ